MADEFALIAATADTGGGTQDFTDASITDPQWMLIVAVGATGVDTPATHGKVSVGIVDASGRAVMVTNRTLDGDTNSANCLSNTRDGSEAKCIILGDNSGPPGAGYDAEASFDSVLSDGFRLTWDTTPGSAYRIFALIVGGSTEAEAGDTKGGQGAEVFNDSFEPEAVLLLTAGATGTPFANDCLLSFGAAAESTSTQASLAAWFDRLADPTQAKSRASTDRALTHYAGNGTLSTSQLTSYNVNGFTMTADSGSPSAVYFGFVNSETREMGAAIETLPGATGTQSFTGLGFKPQVVVGCANLIASSDSDEDVAGASTMCFFAFTEDSEYSVCIRQEDANSIGLGDPTAASSLFDTKALHLLDHLGADAVEASLVSMDPNGFTLNFTSAQAGRMCVFGIEDLGLGPQAHDEDVEVAEEAVALLTRLHAVSEDVEVEEESGELVEDADFLDPFETTGDNAEPGSERGSNALPGSEAGDDATTNLGDR